MKLKVYNLLPNSSIHNKRTVKKITFVECFMNKFDVIALHDLRMISLMNIYKRSLRHYLVICHNSNQLSYINIYSNSFMSVLVNSIKLVYNMSNLSLSYLKNI